VTCRHCGHPNPSDNRFCGMCGHMLSPAATTSEHVSEPVPPRAQQTELPRKAEPDQAPLTGPSFLGLSSEPAASESGGYSYLFQDEPESSHKGLYVFLLLLVIGGGVAYARWQPIRQYVVGNVIPRLRQQASPAPQPPPAPLPPAGDQATISVSSNQPEQKAPEAAPTTPQPSAPEPQKPVPQADKAQAAAPDKADAKSSEDKQPDAAKTKPEVPAESDADEEDTARSAPAVRHTRPQPPAGDALVNTGEKYLYGRGVRKNCNQAITYFRAAAEQQNPRALSRLGTMYAIGECVPLDRAVAYSWFGRALALDRSNRSLERNMSMLWREMSPEERQRAGGR
jgi:Double zinc ribbon/Sel1 repeat